MKYDFDKVTDRRNTGSLKWDVKENELPMWVADMDFQTAPEIMEALRARMEHGIFGYSVLPDEWYTSIQNWWETRHGLRIERDWLIFSSGIVPALSSMVRKLTTPAENVLIQSPVYNCFYSSIRDNGRSILESPLIYRDGKYSMDFADLELKLSNPQTTLMILCNPQNPTGNIWDRETLARVGELCAKHHVTVISDEIHCDLTDPGRDYVPFASVSELCRDISITCIAPSKTFNLAGFQTSALFAADPFLRHKVSRGMNTDELAEPNVFAVTSSIAAFSRGGPWLDELREYLYANKQAVREFVRDKLPQISVVPSEATYLLWLDCSRLCGDAGEFTDFLRERTGLFVTSGAHFGEPGRKFFRFNIACPRAVLEDGLNRLAEGVRLYLEQK